jgi:hypothetical protein
VGREINSKLQRRLNMMAKTRRKLKLELEK